MIRRNRIDATILRFSKDARPLTTGRFSQIQSRDVEQEKQLEDDFKLRQPLTTHTFRYREHGNRPLPLSSFLDPFRLEQRHQHRNRTSKPAPPSFDQLDDFRQRLACNPYARLLAQAVRPCSVTEASLPQALLLNFKKLRDPEWPKAKTLVPVSLHNESVQGLRDGEAAAMRTDRGSGRSIVLNKDIMQWLGDHYRAHRSLKAVFRADLRIPPNIVQTVHDLHAEIIKKSLLWPLQHESKDFVTLPADFTDLSSCPDAAVLLFFRGRVHSKEMAVLEARVDTILNHVDSMIHKAQLKAQSLTEENNQQVPWARCLRRADPRILYPPVGLSTFQYTKDSDDGREICSIPVIPMVDLLGEQEADSLLRSTKHEGAKFIAVRATPATADQIARLLSCAMWIQGGSTELTQIDKKQFPENQGDDSSD